MGKMLTSVTDRPEAVATKWQHLDNGKGVTVGLCVLIGNPKNRIHGQR